MQNTAETIGNKTVQETDMIYASKALYACKCHKSNFSFYTNARFTKKAVGLTTSRPKFWTYTEGCPKKSWGGVTEPHNPNIVLHWHENNHLILIWNPLQPTST